ncbi:MAG: lytic transglycosylase domain-containing protein [Novosphingobium sp.]|nr:lytic transglycosylase domain-containing protein [Novosphingobium sp.]
MSHAASADVLEIGAGGYRWVSVGSFGVAGGVGGGGEGLAEGIDAAAVTAVAGEAGPVAWRGLVGRLAAKYDISPVLLDALVWQESRWRVGAVSRAGARGLAQLMPGTARALGVDADDPRSNLEGGARYLRMQLDAFGGDLEKALAAYNAGPGRVMRAGGIPASLETRVYVASIRARLSVPVRR